MNSAQDRTRREFTRFIKFGVVGVIGAVVDFGSFNLLTGVLQIAARQAQAISFTAAVTSNFIWNRLWTYPDSRSKPIRRQAGQFFLVNLVGLLIRTVIFDIILVRTSGVIPDLLARAPGILSNLEPAVLGRNFALAVAVITVLFWNFGINRIWTYSDVD